jgi:peptidoglycan/xylan/chitin deacetylase (PgdA/CDA1 family)
VSPTDGRARFVISQDFELHWGVRDKRSIDDYRANLLGVRQAIPAVLQLFEQFRVHATWASVGFLFFEGKDDLLAHLPSVLPAYVDQRYSPYQAFGDLGASEDADPFHFAPSLLRQISTTPGQEIGTHTFSHFYCLEPGNDAAAFEADLVAAQKAADRLSIKLRSIVFPRNQVNESYLPICAKLGIRAYRGTQPSKFYDAKANYEQSLLMRAGRLADNYVPLSGHNGLPFPGSAKSFPYDIRASFFLRPFSRRLSPLEPLRKRRIFEDMTFAAKNGHAYHLWWHPHNFGTNLEANLSFLRAVLEHFSELRAQYGMQSVGMAELADEYDHQLRPAA